MEIKIILSDVERDLLGLNSVEFSEADALHLLFDATEQLNRNFDRINVLRGNAPGVQKQLNKTWHERAAIVGLVEGLERITGSGTNQI